MSSLQPWSIRQFSPDVILKLAREWLATARLAQYPAGAKLKDIWLVLGGRGAGKTRLGAEWIHALVHGFPPFASVRYGQIALVGETLQDAREVMVEGPSGILSVSRFDRPVFEPSRRRISWGNGAVAHLFSSEDPDSLRGPQFDAAWCDEVGKWRQADACFDMLQFGMRLGIRPLQLLTTTPRPIDLIRKLLVSDAVTVTQMRTVDNHDFLSAAFLRGVEERYQGTTLGRQELDGELIEDRPDALWSRAQLDGARLPDAGFGLGADFDRTRLRRVVVAVDPPASSGRRAAACGIIVAGLDEGHHVWILHDGTVTGKKPHEWAAQVVSLFHRYQADTIIAEVNQGGEMVSSVLRAIDETLPVRAVHASKSKWSRAEPVAALYERGRVSHVALMKDLEDEMCGLGVDGLTNGRSPDRVDALVWAVSSLLGEGAGVPRIRSV